VLSPVRTPCIYAWGASVAHRTLCFNSYNTKWYQDLVIKVASELQTIKMEDPWGIGRLASLIIEGVFEELAKGREIAYYNPRFGYGGVMHCIFF
jgi:hypothetical protein